MIESQEELTTKEKLDHYSKEIALIMRRVEWDYDMIEKQRNYAFLFIALIVGLKSGSMLGVAPLALVASSILIIMTTRIVGQLDFLSVILDRQIEIEQEIDKMGFSDHYAIQHTYARNFGSGLNFFVSYLLLCTFLISICSYMALIAFTELEILWLRAVHLIFCLTGLSVLIYRLFKISVNRIRSKTGATGSAFGKLKF